MLQSNRTYAGALGALCISLISSACVIEGPQPASPEQSLKPEDAVQTEQDQGKKNHDEQKNKDEKNQNQGNNQKPMPEPEPGTKPETKPEPKPKPKLPVTKYDPPHLQYMVITPGDQVIEQDLGASGSIQYKAVGHFSDGKAKDISDQVTWEVSNSAIGSFSDETLTLAPHNELFVQTTIVTAKLEKIETRSQLTVTAYEKDGANPDFLFVLPYEDTKGSKERVLSFQTKIPSMDVFFSVDATGSMLEERDELLNSLNTTIVPAIKSKIPNTHFGVGAVQDFPYGYYGGKNDQPFRLLTSIRGDVDEVKAGIASIKMGNGRDLPESIFEGLYQVATGNGLSKPEGTVVAENHNGVGGVEFRRQTMPVIISITDAPSHGKDEPNQCNRPYKDEVAKVAHSYAETETALNKICARVITVASDGVSGSGKEECTPVHDGKRLAKSTKTRVSPLAWNGQRPSACAEGKCCTGKNGAGQEPDADGMCPLVFNVNKRGGGLDTSIVSGIEALAFYAPFDVITQGEGQHSSESGKTLPGGEDTTRFIQKIIASGFSDLPRPELPKPKATNTGFEQVTPGTKVQFTIRAFNDFVKPTDKPQVFRAKIRVKADQCEGLDLDEREVVFVVPPRALVAG